MKKKILLIVSLVLLTVQGWALPVDESSARAIVQDFIVEKRGFNPNSVPTSGSSTVQLLHAEMSSVSMTQNAYYIYSTGDGFVIVAGDNRAESILGYGDGSFDMNDIPCGLQFMLEGYKEQIDYLLEHPGLEVETPSLNAPTLAGTSVAPLLTAEWNQFSPYYNLTPLYNGSHCVTGCCCVALCQVMHYWKHPTGDVPSVPAYTTWTHKITVPELESSRFHWNYIKDSYSGSYTADEAYSVAKLMRYVGQAEEMDYSPSGSGATIADILRAAKMFGYDHNAKYIYKRNQYTDAQWASLIQTELRAGRPIVYSAQDSNGGDGHAFNLDGYNASTNLYHINWGWGGSFNGYFALNAFNPVPACQFNEDPWMIIGLKPQTTDIEVSSTSLSFNARFVETKTATIDVKGYELKGNLSLVLNDPEGIYAIDKTSISKTEAINGTTVTVSYSPTTNGSSNASIIISGGGADPKTVNITGNATIPEITVTPLSLSFHSLTGKTETKSFIVQGINIVSALNLTLDDSYGIYSIDKTRITKDDAINGDTVTVTFSPIDGGVSNASITISGGGYSAHPTIPKTISLSGTATKPEITIEPDSLSFNTYVNKTVMKQFTVRGSSLSGELSLALNDSSGNFSIATTNLTPSGSSIYANVTVTYDPIVAGESNAQLTVSGGGAEPKTIVLTGVAKELPVVDIDVNSLSFESTYTGYQTSRSLTITCPNLPDNLQLSLSNDGTGSFGLSKSVITPEAAATGAPVTVYFSPTTGGGKHARLNICYDGCTMVTIPLSGVGIKSDGYITAWPTSLEFETQAGTPVTQTFHVTYSAPNGSIMISSVGGGDVTDSEGGNEGVMLNAVSNLSDLTRTIIPFDSIIWRPKVIIDSLPLVLLKSLVLELTGDDCFEITPSRIRLSSVPCDAYVTVTYHPENVGEHDASIKIKLSMGSAKPFILPLHGSATAPLFAPRNDNDGNDLMITQSGLSINSLVDEMLMNIKVYTEGHNIIIEIPEAENAIISDIAGHAKTVNLQAGRNEIPVNASGIYIVRIREKTTKLMIK